MRADERSPEPAGAAGPGADEVLAMAREAGVPVSPVPAQEEDQAEPTGEEQVESPPEPTPVVLAEPVSEWIQAVAQYAMGMPPVPATALVASFSALCRELRQATQRKDASDVVSLSIVGGAMLLHLYLVATPFYVDEPPPSKIITP